MQRRRRGHRVPPGVKPSESHVRRFLEREHDIFEDVTNTVHIEDFQEFEDHMGEIDFKLSYGYSGRQVALIILHYMLFHDQIKTRDTNYEYGLPSNGITRLLDKVGAKIEEYVNANLQMGTYEERAEHARRHLPNELQNPLATLIIDGTHVPISYSDVLKWFGIEGDSDISYKLSKRAVNIQVVINTAMRAVWIDKGQPGGVHDMRCVWRSNLERIVDQRDVIMGDLGYLNDRLEMLILTPYKKPQNAELSAQQEQYNTIFNGKRVEIEQFFGLLKLRFPIFRCGYRGPIHHLMTLFKLGCVFINKSLDRERLTERELRDAMLFERSLMRCYEDQQFVANIPENILHDFDRRERHGRVVIQYNARQDEDEEWEIANHRRSQNAAYREQYQRLMDRRREREQEERDHVEQRRQQIQQLRAQAQPLRPQPRRVPAPGFGVADMGNH